MARAERAAVSYNDIKRSDSAQHVADNNIILAHRHRTQLVNG